MARNRRIRAELARAEVIPGTQGLTLDFSERKHHRAAAAVTGALGGRQDAPCIVTRVGDALQGLLAGGTRHQPRLPWCARSSTCPPRDAAPPQAAGHAGDHGGGLAELLRRREEIFGLTKRMWIEPPHGAESAPGPQDGQIRIYAGPFDALCGVEQGI